MKLPNNLKVKKIARTTMLAVVLLLVLSVVTIATAQEVQRTFTLVNPTLEHKLNPGDTAEGTTKIINEGSTPLTFNVGVQDFIVSDTIGTPNLLPPSTLDAKYSAAAWIGVTPSTFTVNPRDKQVINYYIQVPRDARPGGHYAAIVYTPVVKKGANATGGVVNTEIGSIFYITINGPITEKSIVSKFFANGFSEYGPVNILTQIKNLGDLHTKAKGTITVSGLFYNQSQNLSDFNVFPGAARDYQNSFGQTLMLGRYKAELLASYGQNNNLPLTATLYFWVFPWRLAVIIILIVIAAILLKMYLKKRKTGGPKEVNETKTEVKEDDTKKEGPRVIN